MREHIQDARNRAVQYAWIDGLNEIGAGFVCLLVAAGFFVLTKFPQTTWITFPLMAVLFAIAYGIKQIVRHIQESSTFPRTGFVAYHSDWKNTKAVVVTVGFSILVLGLQVFFYITHVISLSWGPILAGVIFGFIFVSVAVQKKLKRYIYLAVGSFLLGCGLSLTGWGDLVAATILAVAVGVVLLGVGVATRWAYLKNNPISPEVDNELK